MTVSMARQRVGLIIEGSEELIDNFPGGYNLRAILQPSGRVLSLSEMTDVTEPTRKATKARARNQSNAVREVTQALMAFMHRPRRVGQPSFDKLDHGQKTRMLGRIMLPRWTDASRNKWQHF